MNTKDALKLSFQENHYLSEGVDHFSKYTVTVPLSENSVQYAVHSTVNKIPLVLKFAPSHYLITGRGLNISILKMQIAVL